MAAAEESDPVLRALVDKAENVTLGEDKESHLVPVGAVGFVRVHWTGERANQPGSTAFTATVWMDYKTNKTTLAAHVRFHNPVQLVGVERELKLGPINPQSLPRQMDLVCWSATRPALALQAQLLTLRNHADGDPFTISMPERLTPQECRELEQKLASSPGAGQVRCAYRVVVTLREKGPDGKVLLALGPFRRKVHLQLTGEEREPLPVSITGTVESDVMVGTTQDEGRVRFPPFPRASGSRKNIPIRASVAGLQLELDRDRTAAFLDARLEPEKGLDGLAAWRLYVEVPPNRVSGPFPRDDDPLFRDSAIYLKIRGPEARSIRIPVEGLADES
jgi:hypothetical protein